MDDPAHTPIAADEGASPPRRRVAVVAVHGVADQKPGDSARCAADLLTRGGAYLASEEQRLRLAVEPIDLNPDRQASMPRVPNDGWAGWRRYWSLLTPSLQARRAGGQAPGVDLSYEWLRGHFDDLRLPEWDRIYDTVRYTLTPRDRRSQRPDVHVYEMYWADLSRLGYLALTIVAAFFLLLFALAVEGARSLSTLRAERMRQGQDDWAWIVFEWVHGLAVRLLVLGVPALALLFAGLMSNTVVYFLPDAWRPWVPATVVAVGLVLLLGRRLEPVPHYWWLALGVPLLAAMTLAWVGLEYLPLGHQFGLALGSWWMVVGAVCAWLMSLYQRRSAGALPVMVGLWLGLFVAAIYFAYSRAHFFADLEHPDKVLDGLKVTTEWLIHWMHWPLWGALAGLCLFTMLLWGVVWLRAEPSQRQEVGSVGATAIFSLSASALAVLVTSLSLWALAPGALHLLPLANPGKLDFVQQQLVPLIQSAMPGAIHPMLLLLIGALAIAAWVIFPAALADLLPHSRGVLGTWSSRALGINLSTGLRRMPLAITLIWAVAAFGIGFSAWIYYSGGSLPLMGGHRGLFWAGLIFFVAVTGSKGIFRFLALGFRSALDIALDIVNWLRTDPPGQSPGGRICSRYYRLLSYLSHQGYDAVVIFAHSQGTVISADLLRFLDREWPQGAPALECWNRGVGADDDGVGEDDAIGEAAKPNLPIRLFTMGCPLRQIYARCFPIRYGWAKDSANPWQESTACRPDDLKIWSWSNVYRSGDYVGRYLWHRDGDPAQTLWGVSDTEGWQQSDDGRRRELCLGVGSHMRYWDVDPPDLITADEGWPGHAIADELQRLVEVPTPSGSI